MVRAIAVSCLLALALSGCSSEDVVTTGEPAPGTDGSAPTSGAAPEAAVTRSVAPSFVEVDLEAGTVTARVPDGWTLADGGLEGRFHPQLGSGFDRERTRWWVRSSCAGPCESRTVEEWRSAADREEFAPTRSEVGEDRVVRDQVLGSVGRVLVTGDGQGGLTMTVARWSGSAERYLRCTLTGRNVELDEEILVAFEQACMGSTAVFLG